MNIFEEISKINQFNGEKTALTIALGNGNKRSYTYLEIFQKVDEYAQAFQSAGVHSGDRVAIAAENSPEWDIAYLAIMKQQCTAVLIDASLPKEEILTLLEKSDPRCIFLSEKVFEKLGASPSADLPVLNVMNCQPFPGCPRCVSGIVPPTPDGDAEIANIIFSSGTTRSASSIMHTHDSLIKTTLMTIENNGLKSSGRFLAIIPNSHIYGIICVLLGPLLLGADVYFVESLSAENIVKAFQVYRPTILPAVPKVYDLFKTQIIRKIDSQPASRLLFKTFFPVCLKLRKSFGINLGKVLFKTIHKGFGGDLDILCSAGAPMSAETAEFYLGTGFNLLITYGATETNIPTIGNRQKNLTSHSCGKPYPDISIKLSESGEILIRSPYMMKGYFRDEAATAEAFDADGWFKSGDTGQFDEKGNIIVTGRCKENIVLATGKKLTPDFVETYYAGVAGIKDLVICGVPAKDGAHDEIHAFVVADSPVIDEAILLERITGRSTSVPPMMKIHKVHFVDEIQKTSLQKPKRYILRKLALQERDQPAEAVSLTSHKAVSLETSLIEIVAHVAETESSNVHLNTRPFVELAIDSLSSIKLALEIEEKFGIPNMDLLFSKEMTVADLVDIIRDEERSESQDARAQEMYPLQKRNGDFQIFNFISKLIRYTYNVSIKNDHLLPENSGYIICANHVSYFDYLYLTLNFSKQRFQNFCCMAKKDLFNKSITSLLMTRICGMVPIDRGGINRQAMASLRNKLKEKWGVLIHPEGTRSESGNLGRLKNGAALLAIEAGVPVIPAYIKGGYEIYPKGKLLPNLFNWKKMKKYKVEVIYGEPIFPMNVSAEELTQMIELAISKLQLP